MLSLYNIYTCGSILIGRDDRYTTNYTEMDRRNTALTPHTNSSYLLSQQMPVSSHADQALISSSFHHDQAASIPCQLNSSFQPGTSLQPNFCQIRQSQTLATARSVTLHPPQRPDFNYRSDTSQNDELPPFPSINRKQYPALSQNSMGGTFQGPPNIRNSNLRQHPRSKSNERRKPEKTVSFRGPILSD